MNYDDAMNSDERVSKSKALREVRRHGIDAETFFSEMGEWDDYNVMEVMIFLGY